MKTKITQTILTCPECETKQEAEMPTDACQYFYNCIKCKVRLKPKQGDCCVFCSYAEDKCPPLQK